MGGCPARGGVAPFFVDIRTPMEMAAGVLPGAHRFPEQSIKDHLATLPAKDVRVTVYDQTGEQGSIELAAWLREQGWGLARRLPGRLRRVDRAWRGHRDTAAHTPRRRCRRRHPHGRQRRGTALDRAGGWLRMGVDCRRDDRHRRRLKPASVVNKSTVRVRTPVQLGCEV